MYGPGYPYQRPPPPPRQGLSPAAIVLIILSVIFVMGAGSCVVCTGLIGLGASAEPDPATGPTVNGAPPVATGAPGVTPGPTGASADPSDEGDPTAAGQAPAGQAPAGQAPAGQAPAGGRPAGQRTFFCNATGFVRVCGFANVCNNMLVSGIGSSTDQGVATMMARNACQGQIIARGGTGTCTVTCSMR